MSIWKAFKVGDLFERSNEHQIKTPLKFLDTKTEKDEDYKIAVITASSTNQSIVGYVKETETIKPFIRKNMLALTMDGSKNGVCFYDEFSFITTGHNNVIKIKSDNIRNMFDSYEDKTNVYNFLAKSFTKIYRNRFHHFGRSIAKGKDFEREYILLPVKKTDEEDYVVAYDDSCLWTLDLDVMKEINITIENNKKEEKIKSLSEELEFYKNELSNYEIHNHYHWSALKVGDLFERSNEHQVKTPLKFLDTHDVKDEDYNIAVITAATTNNSIVGYVKETEDIKPFIRQNMLAITMDGYSGVCFYENFKFISTGSNNVVKPFPSMFNDLTEYANNFLARSFTKIYRNRFHHYGRKLAKGKDFEREYILLPVDDNGVISTEVMENMFIKIKINEIEQLLKKMA